MHSFAMSMIPTDLVESSVKACPLIVCLLTRSKSGLVEKLRTQNRALWNAIVESDLLRLQTIYGDCLGSFRKLRQRPEM